MDFINTRTGQWPVSLQQLRAAYPGTLFPAGFAGAFGDHAPVLPTAPPAYKPATHKLEPVAPVLQGGQWRQAWQVRPLTAAEIEAARRALVPTKVTRRQARQALLLAGLLDAVQPAINAIADPVQRQLAKIEWDDAQEFERDRQLVVQIGAAIGLDDAGLDSVFIRAATL